MQALFRRAKWEGIFTIISILATTNCLFVWEMLDKGMPAALFMSGLMIWIQAKAASHMTPAQIVTAINEEVANDDSTMFATLFLAIADTLTGHLTYCDAGHVRRITGPGGVRELETAKHLPVGIFADEQYRTRKRCLSRMNR